MCYSWYVQFKYCNSYSDNFHLNLQSLFYQQKKSDKTDFLYPPKKARHNIITKPFKSTLNCWVQGLYYELHQVPVQNEVQMFELFMTVPVYLIANCKYFSDYECILFLKNRHTDSTLSTCLMQSKTRPPMKAETWVWQCATQTLHYFRVKYWSQLKSK